MEPVNRKIFIGALLLTILFVSVLVFWTRTQMPVSVSIEEKMQSLFIAKRDILQGEKISEQMIYEKMVQKDSVHPHSVVWKDDLLNAYATQTIYKDEPILDIKIDQTPLETRVQKIPDGKRAISIPVNAVTGILPYPREGDRVDVVVFFDSEQEGILPTYLKSAQIAVQNAVILSSGLAMDLNNEMEHSNRSVLTLLVTPDEAEKIVFAVQFGGIHLILRGVSDTEEVLETPVKRESF